MPWEYLLSPSGGVALSAAAAAAAAVMLYTDHMKQSLGGGRSSSVETDWVASPPYLIISFFLLCDIHSISP